MKRASRKVEGGKLVAVDVATADGRVEDIEISGDFFAHPEESIHAVEDELVGTSVDAVEATVQTVLAAEDAELVGIDAADIADLVAEVEAR